MGSFCGSARGAWLARPWGGGGPCCWCLQPVPWTCSSTGFGWNVLASGQQGQPLECLLGQAGLCASGMEVPPVLSLAQPSGQSPWRSQKMGGLGCFPPHSVSAGGTQAGISVGWPSRWTPRTGQALDAQPPAPSPVTWEGSTGAEWGRGLAHPDPDPMPAKSVVGPARLVDTDVKIQRTGHLGLVLFITCGSYLNEKV